MKYFRARPSKLALLLIVASLLGAVGFAQPTYAADCGGVQTVLLVCVSSEAGPIVTILVLVMQVLTALVGIAAIGAFVYAGLMYSSAGDDSGKVVKAKELIRNTAIGLVVYVLVGMALIYLVPGGPFSGKFTWDGDAISLNPSTIPTRPGSGGGSGGGGSNLAGACYNIKVTKADIAIKDRFHVPGNKPYAFENSLQGIDYAADHGYKAIDMDTMLTKDGVLVVSHAWYPLKSGKMGGFKDTAGKMKKDKRLSEMTIAEVRRLEHKDGYRISTLEEMIVRAKSRGVNMLIEMKNAVGIEKKLPYIAALLNKYKVKAGIMSRKDKTGYKKALATARSLGFYTRMATSPGATAKDKRWVNPTRTSPLCR